MYIYIYIVTAVQTVTQLVVVMCSCSSMGQEYEGGLEKERKKMHWDSSPLAIPSPLYHGGTIFGERWCCSVCVFSLVLVGVCLFVC